MPNFLQKLIYNLSTVVPLFFIFSIVWFFQKHTFCIPIIAVVLGIAIGSMFKASFAYGKRNIPLIDINVTNISPYDGWLVIYIITYMLPFASIILKDFNVIICAFIAAVLAFIAPLVNTAIPNPLLFIKGYHFYKIGAENGISEYVLISKRKLRRSSDIRRVKRIFEFLLLDSKEK